MIIWGGDDGATFTNTGSYYDFNASTWTALSTTSAPSARADFVMILAKDKFVVWGGVDSSANAIGDGGIYDLAGGTWTATATTGAPSARSQSSSVYADQSMVIWGGKNGATSYNDGFRLNTQTNSWTALSSSGLSARYGAQMVWTGTVGDGRANGSKSYRNNLNGVTSRLMIWGGYDGASYQNDGKIHNLPFQ
jgi:N-acetylneuraminic acid mutarotase